MGSSLPVLLLQIAVLLQLVNPTNAFLCDLPFIGIIFQILFPFLCGDSGVGTETPPIAPTAPDAPPVSPPVAPPDGNLPEGPTGILDGFDLAGCFATKVSLDSHVVSELPSINERAVACRSSCSDRTRLFGVDNDSGVCYCYTERDPPRERLALGACATVNSEQKMELYFAEALTTECTNDQVQGVRDTLVLQNAAQFGFDIVTNEFRDDIFEFLADECGTNIYEVQTRSSSTTGTLRTTVSSVQEYAESLRTERSRSWEASVSASYRGALFSVSASVSASGDSEQNSLLESSGARIENSFVFTSIGVRRVAYVGLSDFDNRFSFVSFNQEFGNLLIAYRDSGHSVEIARQLMDRYGQFVLTSGLYGGYFQFRSTIQGSSISSTLDSDEDTRNCYEVSAEASGSAFGFQASVSGSVAGCDASAQAAFQASQDTFERETGTTEVYGGRIGTDGAGNSFLEVPVGEAELLRERDKYPSGSEGPTFRLLSDFLDPSKISPLDVRNLQITEDEFRVIREKLQNQILDYLEEINDLIKNCGCSAEGLPYIVKDNDTGKQECKCYEPVILF